MIERASDFQTAGTYCDATLRKTFQAECDSFESPWLVHLPTHLPLNVTDSSWQIKIRTQLDCR